MTVEVADALQVLPTGLREDLLQAFNEIVNNYRAHRWEPSELNGGKLCEAAYSIARGFLDGGEYPLRAQKPQNMLSACMGLEKEFPRTPDNHSARILMPRVIIGLFDFRNNRGVGHTGGDVDPNHMDATFILYACKWLMAEIVRLVHPLTTEGATVLVESLIEREVPLVWTHEDMKRVLRPELTWKQQTLVLLLAEADGVPESRLMSWLEHGSLGDFRKNVLRPLHRARQIEYDTSALTVRILEPGVTAIEDLMASLGA